MIATTLGVLANAEPALKRLSEIRLNVKVAYALGKMIRAVAAETPHYHTERDKLVRELGNPMGDQVMVMPEHMGEFVRRVTELGELPVELAIEPFSLTTLGDIEMSGGDMCVLLPLMSD